MAIRILTVAFFVCLAGSIASAQSYTTIPMLGGGYLTTGPGGPYTTDQTLGGGWLTTGPGYSATTIQTLGGGYLTTVNSSDSGLVVPLPIEPNAR